jgi:fatty-acyl-CoA synthase
VPRWSPGPPRSLIDALEQRHGIEVAQAWGMTEALGVTKCALPPGLADAPYEQRVEQKLRQGRVAFSTKLRIVDDAGKPLPHDGVAFGHLQARGPLIAGAYLKTEAPISEGWLQTGDVAKLFPDGTVEIVDRSKDVIKSGGEGISSAAVENAAMGHPAVAQAAVIGIHHPTWQERPCWACEVQTGMGPPRSASTSFCCRWRDGGWQSMSPSSMPCR